MYFCRRFRDVSSVGLERCFHTAEVTGSNPVRPTKEGHMVTLVFFRFTLMKEGLEIPSPPRASLRTKRHCFRNAAFLSASNLYERGIGDPFAAAGVLANEKALLSQCCFFVRKDLSPASGRRFSANKKGDAFASPFCLRRDRDSNPRSAFGAYTLSRRAPSTTRPSLPENRAAKVRKIATGRAPLQHFFAFFIF